MPKSNRGLVAGDGAPNSAAPPPPSSAEEVMQTITNTPLSRRKRLRAHSPSRFGRGPTPHPRACLTRQVAAGRLRSKPSNPPSPARLEPPEPAPSSSQVLPPHPDSNPVRDPSPTADLPVDVQCDEVELQRVLTRGTVVSLNVGPVGLASSLPTLAPTGGTCPSRSTSEHARADTQTLPRVLPLRQQESEVGGAK
jgi:hypothetical protein